MSFQKNPNSSDLETIAAIIQKSGSDFQPYCDYAQC
jgi:hypothetical protein